MIDTTNQFGSGPKPTTGQTAATFNAQRFGEEYRQADAEALRAGRPIPPTPRYE